MRLKHLPARSSLSLFNCTLLIGKCLHFLIAFDSDCHTEDDFSLFLSWWRVFLQCSSWPFYPSASVFWVHLWHLHTTYMMLSALSQTKYLKFRGFFPICFSLWHSVFLYYSSTLTAFGIYITSKKLWDRVKVPFPCLQCMRNSWYPHIVLNTKSEKVGVCLGKSFCLSHLCSKYSKHTYCLL